VNNKFKIGQYSIYKAKGVEYKLSYFQKANELYNVREYKRAIELYMKAIEVKENEAAAYYNSAVCFIKLNKYDRAIFLLKKAINLKMDSKYFFNLGYCYAMLKDNKKALIYFNTAWSIDNSDKDCEKAINLILKGYKKNP
jgi:tetratricopeptide (TPR) repeat protein